MNWTHVLSFALGASWMLLVLLSTMLVRRSSSKPVATVTPIRPDLNPTNRTKSL